MPARRAARALVFAVVASTALAAACARSAAAPAADPALADTLTRRIADAYDFSRPDPTGRLMDLYPARGAVVSAAAGRVTTSREALAAEIGRFWERVGQNMQRPRFVIAGAHATRLGPDAGVLTLTYSIPHHTPEGRAHVLGGAWTAVFARQQGRWVIVQEHLSDLPPQPVGPAGPAGTPPAVDGAAPAHQH